MKKQSGFTLVELSIVLVIVGLMIGGVLVGQDLMETAQINQTIKQWKQYDGAIGQFNSMYKILPGDITDPGSRLEGCNYSPCNVGGNGNGIIGEVNGDYMLPVTSENNAMWHHLAADKLVENIDYKSASRVHPPTPLGGTWYFFNYDYPTTARYTEGLYGSWWIFWDAPNDVVARWPTPMYVVQRLDEKSDDGKPWTGRVILGGDCGITFSGNNYPVGETVPCLPELKTSF